MNSLGTEIEVKFYVERLADLPRRLQEQGGRRLHARAHELNLRFDTPDGALKREGRTLRLRRDTATTLTYKGPSSFRDGVRSRIELEVAVEDLEGARKVLEALGYVVTFTYEKFRTTYGIDEASIMLDELPFGDFVEIEGEPDALKSVAARLGLVWQRAVKPSYLGLFEQVRRSLSLPFNDLTFANFKGRTVLPSDLDVTPADV